MKKKLGVILLSLIFVGSSLGINTIALPLGIGKTEVVEAAPATWKSGSKYWDGRNGRYVVNSYPIYKGSTLNRPGINTLLNKANSAVKQKYGRIDNNKPE
ncbi:hypothetical protein KAG23_13775 [Enterococcus faecalis]|uniref:hypothetical protein n=1 Tax=Enterococcus faecalis TaxID=1351 RepID=UPI001B31E380|nr:hypothetical protein [Enterococcus faecalis]MBP4090239.1 hypothetical protein [Enterococcus faecalis]